MPSIERVEKTVFLSYRRTNIPWALAIYQNLTQHGFDVFFDFNGIASGDFERVILGNIVARAHFLVLLTPSALERCGSPDDWLRREIETALDNQRNTVPLMLEGFHFGTPKIAAQLTGTLGALRHYNGLSIPPEYFTESMERLRERYLNVPLRSVLHPVSVAAAREVTAQNAAAAAAPSVQQEELTAQQWFERGFAATDHDEEIRFFTEAIRLKPDYPSAIHNRGVARQVKGDIAGAIEDYTEAIRLKPDHSGAFYNRGYSRQATGDIAGAIDDYNEVIRLKSDDSDAFYNRGNARQANGDIAGAIDDYNEAIRLKPDDSNTFINRGVARKAAGDIAGAIDDYDEAIRLKPDYSRAFYNRGNARQATGDIAGAIDDYTEAIRLKPDHFGAFYNRGVARKAKGHLQLAGEDFAEAKRLDLIAKAQLTRS
jgi:tetratricopeptide (TPR) repeat protein